MLTKLIQEFAPRIIYATATVVWWVCFVLCLPLITVLAPIAGLYEWSENEILKYLDRRERHDRR